MLRKGTCVCTSQGQLVSSSPALPSPSTPAVCSPTDQTKVNVVFPPYAKISLKTQQEEGVSWLFKRLINSLQLQILETSQFVLHPFHFQITSRKPLCVLTQKLSPRLALPFACASTDSQVRKEKALRVGLVPYCRISSMLK